MKIRGYLALIVCGFALSACETVQGFKEDFSAATSKAGQFTTTAASSSNTSLLTPCPHVEIIEDLAALNEFTDISKPSQSSLISRVDMYKIGDSCKTSSRSVTVDLKLGFEGQLGPKGKATSNDMPFFTYPYFVAVTAPNGDIMAKEVFAASITYNRGEDRHTHYENLRHLIPMDNLSRSGNYKVLIGFQMSQDQLAFNRNEIKQKAADEKARIAAEKEMKKLEAATGVTSAPTVQPNQPAQMTVTPAQKPPGPVDITAPQ